jgi:hypothetical protein
VLFTWAPGAKPTPGLRTYRLLGEAAARSTMSRMVYLLLIIARNV